MSVPRPGSMRGSQVRSPLLLLLLLLLLEAGTVLCQDEEENEAADDTVAEEDMSAGDPAAGDGVATDPGQDDPETTSAMNLPPTKEESQVADTSEVDAEAGSGTTDTPSEGATNPSVTSQNESLSSTIILVPVGLVVLIIAMIVCGIFISRRCTKDRKKGLKEEDPYLDGSATEKVPMPMFEEDVPSVLELEMEELDQLMQQDGEATKKSMQA